MALQEILAANPRRVALDVEGDSFYRFGERLCLVQIAFSGTIRVLDPLDADLGPLFSDLETRELILHGADFDLRLLHARYLFQPRHVFDTMLAARFLNFPKFGLSDLYEKFFGIVLEKKHQRADWCTRPLSPELLDYAKRTSSASRSSATVSATSSPSWAASNGTGKSATPSSPGRFAAPQDPRTPKPGG